jgi:hypothetical protein
MLSGEAVQSLWPWLHVSALSAARHAHAARSPGAWTIAAFVVAAAGAGIVAWQAWETHRTTALGQKALDASAALAIDGARWDLSQDGARSLQVQARVKVRNLMGDRTTHLKVTGLHDPAMNAGGEVLLLPTTERIYFLTATFTLGQWAENWKSHRDGEPAPNVAEGCVISGDDRDEGVVDRWPLRLAAWPIQPDGDSDGTWQLTAGTAGEDWFIIAMRPLRERSYWISQQREIPLPDLPERPGPGH